MIEGLTVYRHKSPNRHGGHNDQIIHLEQSHHRLGTVAWAEWPGNPNRVAVIKTKSGVMLLETYQQQKLARRQRNIAENQPSGRRTWRRVGPRETHSIA